MLADSGRPLGGDANGQRHVHQLPLTVRRIRRSASVPWATARAARTSSSTISRSTSRCPASTPAWTPSTAMPATTRSSGTPMRRLRPTAVTSSTAAPKAPLGDTFVINGNATSGDLPHLHAGGLGCGCRQRPRQLRRTYAGDRRHPRRHRPRQCHRRAERDRGNPHQRCRSVGQPVAAGSRRHLRDLRRLLRHQPAPQHHHHRWRGRRRHDRHLGSQLGAPYRLQVQWWQRHHHRDPPSAGRDRTAGRARLLRTTQTSTANGVTTMTNGDHSITYTAAGEGPQVGPGERSTRT